jgi:hypothetical protein
VIEESTSRGGAGFGESQAGASECPSPFGFVVKNPPDRRLSSGTSPKASYFMHQEADMWRRKMLASLRQELETIALFDRVHDFTLEHDSADDRAYASRQIRRSQIVAEIKKLRGDSERSQ